MATRTWGDLLDDVRSAIAARDWDRGENAMAWLRQEAEHQGDPKSLASAAFCAGMFHDARGAYPAAEAAFGEAASWDERAWGPVHHGVADALRSLAMVQARQKKLQTALANFDRAADIHHTLGNVALEAETLCTAGNTFRLAGDLDEAFAFFAEARKVVQGRTDLPSRIERAHASVGLSECKRQTQDYVKALGFACEGTQDGADANDALRTMLARNWCAIGFLERRVFRNESATALAYAMALALTNDPTLRALATKELAASSEASVADAPIPHAVVAHVDPKGWARVYHREYGAVVVDPVSGCVVGDRVQIARDANGPYFVIVA